ncbi:MAG: YqgE/AlgH family protein [Alphaproteobacteria bacterium]|nr:YqgE/AlgH family protein [Alphaproteobacteria bacterium]
MAQTNIEDIYLPGQLLIAMPSMTDPRFEKSVIYMCSHNSDGAMGLVINRAIDSLTFPELLEQLEIDSGSGGDQIRVLFGGPVEQARGFVLHSPDYLQDASLVVDDNVVLTATIDILRAIADGTGPNNCLLALGYAGWGAGQLDSEIKSNGWLSVDADEDLVFGCDLDEKWERAMTKIGIDPRMLSDAAGHA